MRMNKDDIVAYLFTNISQVRDNLVIIRVTSCMCVKGKHLYYLQLQNSQLLGSLLIFSETQREREAWISNYKVSSLFLISMFNNIHFLGQIKKGFSSFPYPISVKEGCSRLPSSHISKRGALVYSQPIYVKMGHYVQLSMKRYLEQVINRIYSHLLKFYLVL